MATHSSIHAWEIPRTEEPGGLQFMAVKNLSAMQETQVRSLGQEDPLEEGMATHSNILAWRIPRSEKSGHGVARVGHNLATTPPPPSYRLQEF